MWRRERRFQRPLVLFGCVRRNNFGMRQVNACDTFTCQGIMLVLSWLVSSWCYMSSIVKRFQLCSLNVGLAKDCALQTQLKYAGTPRHPKCREVGGRPTLGGQPRAGIWNGLEIDKMKDHGICHRRELQQKKHFMINIIYVFLCYVCAWWIRTHNKHGRPLLLWILTCMRSTLLSFLRSLQWAAPG